jgi:predicted 3-demethylubiquinone-9 3-methyltransferase (glyoxalase superfamily)
MNTRLQRVTPFLWFNNQAEEAAGFYTGIFPNSRILTTTRYTREASEASGQPAGSVMTVAFQLDGQDFTALNGGPVFNFTPAVSLVVNCQTEEEVDHYWNKLSDGGDERAQQCGWLSDRYGLSWQVVPTEMIDMLQGSDAAAVSRVTAAIMRSKKLDLKELRRAAAG